MPRYEPHPITRDDIFSDNGCNEKMSYFAFKSWKKHFPISRVYNTEKYN